MFKEVAQIQQLEKRRERLSFVLEQRENLPGKIGTGKIRTGITIEDTLRIGNVRKSVKESAGKLKDSLETFEGKAEPVVLEIARIYPELVEQRRSQLAQLSELVADPDTGLTEDDLRIHQLEFEELVSLPQKSTLFQKGLEKVRGENQIEQEPDPESVDAKPVSGDTLERPANLTGILSEQTMVYQIPGGEEVAGKAAQLLHLLTIASNQNPINNPELLERLFPSDEAAETKLANVKEYVKKLIENTDLVWNDSYEQVSTSEASFVQDRVFLGYYIENKTKATKADGMPLDRVDSFIQKLPEENKWLFTQVRDSEDFKFASEIVLKHSQGDAGISSELRSNLAGNLFETFSYLYLKEQLAVEGKVLLSPKETFEIYLLLNPDRRKIINASGLQMGIDGISVPDGIIIGFTNRNVPRIEGICEYSLRYVEDSNSKRKLTRLDSNRIDDMRGISELTKIKSNTIAGYIKSRYPIINSHIWVSESPGQYTVLPEGESVVSEDSRVEIIHVPVTRLAFRTFISAIMDDKISKKEATK